MISRGKLSLKEELSEDESTEVEGEISTGKVDKNAVCNIIHELIRGEWDTISNMEMYLQPLVEGGADDECIEAIKEVLDDEYMHVGVYENLLMKINPNAELIDDGRVELENKESEGEDVEEEDVEEEDDGDDEEDEDDDDEDEDDESLNERYDQELQKAKTLKKSIMKLFRSAQSPGEVVDSIKEAFKMAGGSCECKLNTSSSSPSVYVKGSVPLLYAPYEKPLETEMTIKLDDMDYSLSSYGLRTLSSLAVGLASDYYKSIGGMREGIKLDYAIQKYGETNESLTESVDLKLQQARDLKDSIMKLFRSNECPEVVDCIKEAFKMAGGSCRCKIGTGILGSYAYVDGSVPVPNGRPYTIGKTIRVDYVGDMYDDLSHLAEDLAAAYYKSIGGELEGYSLIQALGESKNVNESTELTEASRNLEEIEKEYEEAYGKELDWDSVPVVSFTDKFLSGWGEAENKNWRQVILCGTSVEAANIEDNIRRKSGEMGASRVNRSFGRKYNPSKESYSVAVNSPAFL